MKNKLKHKQYKHLHKRFEPFNWQIITFYLEIHFYYYSTYMLLLQEQNTINQLLHRNQFMTTFPWQQSLISLIRVKYQRWECLHWSHISMMTKELIIYVSKPGLWSCSRGRIWIYPHVSADQHLKPCVQIACMSEKKTEVSLILTESLCQHIQLLLPRVSWSTSRVLTRPRKATNDRVCGHSCRTPQWLAAFP